MAKTTPTAPDPSAPGDRTGARVVAERMAQAASDLLAALDGDQNAKARFNFADDAERTRWFYTPNARGGLPLGEMTPRQQRLAHALVASGLSPAGYVTASTIIGLENTLDAMEDWRRTWYPERGRDPGMYFVTVFGEPQGNGPWGWRFEGHHVSLHYTIADGRVDSPTPTFFGSDPAEVSFVGPGVLRPLAGEEDLARALVHALTDAQRATAIISAAAPPDIVQGNRPRVIDGALPIPAPEMMGIPTSERWKERMQRDREELGLRDEHFEALRYSDRPKGLPAADMTAGQRDALTALIRQYIDRMPDALAAVETAKLGGDALAAVHFAWAGGLERRQPHYYRLQGPRFLVEYDNVQHDVNHIHAVWRDPRGDFGAGLLARHAAAAHR